MINQSVSDLKPVGVHADGDAHGAALHACSVSANQLVELVGYAWWLSVFGLRFGVSSGGALNSKYTRYRCHMAHRFTLIGDAA